MIRALVIIFALLTITPAMPDSDGPMSITPLHRHGWFDGKRNPAGEWCCGAGDCLEMEPVRVTPNGYLIMSLGETVPYSEVQPSPDGKYWRCKRPDGSRRCFFAPPFTN